ncbi:hypothetical protein CAEBREN_14960 [Caenorhabditis brenneri]|uniref:Uncharacterized protein n=1 Tax=Caenorhabditis brenneri TaxID=135651 RepID=G0N8G1_CAEBE|nr:hypothetical protein CAEBREN_14960 [Caenorhabditis brenneri]
MIFEVPIDHFPATTTAQQVSRARENKPLRLSTVSLHSKEVNAAVAPLSPSVRRSQFNFSCEVQKTAIPKVRATIPPLKRALTSPALPVQHLNLNLVRKGSNPSSQTSRNNSVSDLLKSDIFKMPSRLLSTAVSLHQLA